MSNLSFPSESSEVIDDSMLTSLNSELVFSLISISSSHYTSSYIPSKFDCLLSCLTCWLKCIFCLLRLISSSIWYGYKLCSLESLHMFVKVLSEVILLRENYLDLEFLCLSLNSSEFIVSMLILFVFYNFCLQKWSEIK